MVAVLKDWNSLHSTVLEDARLANGNAHLEAPEVPKWIAEGARLDIAGELCEALSDLEDKPREKFNALLADLCQHGEDIPQRKAMEMLDMLRSTLTDHCVAQAQDFVERELP